MAPLLDIFTRLFAATETVWKSLRPHIDKGTATLIFVTLTMLVVFVTILFSLVVALIFLNSFL